MESKDQLFQLIKALDKNEKRYFRLDSRFQGQEKQYMELFDAVDQLDEYNVSALRSIIHNKKIIRRLAFNKYYLQKLILKSLRSYSSCSTMDMELKELLSDVELFFNKRLYQAGARLISRGKRLARKYEKHLILIELLKWERKMAGAHNPSAIKRTLVSSFAEEDHAYEQLRNLRLYEQLSRNFFYLTARSQDVRTKKEYHELNKLMKHPLLNDKKNSLSFHAEFYFRNMHAVFFRIKGEKKKSYKFTYELLKFLETRPWHIRENCTGYISVLSNFLGISSVIGEYEEFQKALEKLKNISARHSHYRALVFERVYVHETDFHLFRGTFDKAVLLTDKVEEGFRLYKGKLGKVAEISLLFNMGYACFGAGDMRGAIQWFTKVLHHTDINLRDDLQSMARIINLLAHFELNHEDIMDYVTKNIFRFLYKRNHLYRFEILFLGYLKKISRTAVRTARIDLYKELKNELAKLKKDRFEKQAFQNFDMISWLESKIENRTFAEIIKEKTV